jgi:transposase
MSDALSDPLPPCVPDPHSPDGTRRLVHQGNRHQSQMIFGCLDDQLPEDHRARVVDDAVRSLDLGEFYQDIGSTEGRGGRPAHDPRVLLGLWLLAILDGYGSARELSRLVDEHNAYRWLAHGQPVSYHTLSSFRVDHGAKLDGLLSQLIAALVHEGLVRLEQVAQDGMRVRAAAGAASFHREKTLASALADAEARVQALAQELRDNPGAHTARQRAARERAARERAERLRKALQTAQELRAEQAAGAKEPRVSSTDPEARVMKQGDGGFRPSYNVNLATDVATQVIVGVVVTNRGSDNGEAAPMQEQVIQRTGIVPQDYLVDGGFTKHADIDALTDAGSRVIAPVPKPKDPARDPHQPRPDDSPAVASWRARMGEAAIKVLYHLRAATAECVNAHFRNRGMRGFATRGQDKATTWATWHALAQNLVRAAVLRAPSIA